MEFLFYFYSIFFSNSDIQDLYLIYKELFQLKNIRILKPTVEQVLK